MLDQLEQIFEEFIQKGIKEEISLKELETLIGKYKNSIVLYGAGSAGIAFMHYLKGAGYMPVAFADGNEKKWGSSCEGLPIVAPKNIKEIVVGEPLIIVTINTDGKRYCKSFQEALRVHGHMGVHKALHDLGYEHVIDYTYFRKVFELFRGDKYNLPSCSDVFLMNEQKEKIKQAYSLLSNDESRQIFLDIIRFRLNDDSISIKTNSQDEQYFEYDLYKPINNEIIVDCGAFNGNSLETFLKKNTDFKQYIAIEPDRSNYALLSERINSLEQTIKEKICIYPYICWDKEKMVKLYSLNGPGSFVSDIGNEYIESRTIDQLLQGQEATMIKMNIEGSEIQALKGAKNTISKYAPVLAIAGYHKTWDIWEVPLIIHQYYQDYNFYLRSYMNHISFIFYAVPKWRLTE